MQVEFKGVTELIAKLQAGGKEISGPGMRKALRAGAEVVLDAIVERTPEIDEKTPGSDSLNPGDLKRSMRIYSPAGADPAEVLIGPSAKTAHVARWVEYGHRQVSGGYLKLLGDGKTRGTGVAGVDVPAHPFLRPAFESSAAEAGEAIQKSLAETIQKVTS